MGKNSQDELLAESARKIGGTAPVLAAGIFGLKSLVVAQVAGMAGAQVVSDASGLSAVGGSLTDGIAAGLGAAAATKAYAESQGVTVQLILAVTEKNLYILNRDTNDRLAELVMDFDRATCEVTISKFGLSRFIKLTDPASGEEIELHGSTGPFSSLAKADAVVLHLLSEA